MRTFLLTTALLLSSAASAQVKFTFGTSNRESLSFGKADCPNPVSVTWTRTIQPCDRLTLWISTTGACQATVDTSKGDLPLDEVSLATFQGSNTGTFNLPLSRLPFGTSDAGTGGCGSTTEERTFTLCGATKQPDYYTSCNTAVSATAAKIIYDGMPPATPSVSASSGFDRAASITVNAPGDAIDGRVRVYRDNVEVRAVEWSVGKGAILVDGLENDVTYEVDAFVADEAGNQSEPSARVQVTPTKTYGFMEHYAGSGGQEMGGCGAVGGGVAGGAVLAVLGFWLFSRRNRSWLEQ